MQMGARGTTGFIAGCVLLFSTSGAHAQATSENLCQPGFVQGEVLVATARIRLSARNATISKITNLVTGELHTRAAGPAERGIPRGLGHLTGDPATAGAVHPQWGVQAVTATDYLPFHRAGRGATLSVASTPGGCIATWTGLTNGASAFPSETLALEFALGTRGELLFRAVGTSPNPGVFGALVPIIGLHGGHRIHVPSFGGVMYDADTTPGLHTLDRAPFWEAPVVALETDSGSLGLWVEDDTFRPNMFFMYWSGSRFELGLEQLNLLPFDGHRRVETPWLHLDAFNGNWVEAMTPYRDWYAERFALELAQRAAASWPHDIRVIVDEYTGTEDAAAAATYQTLAKEFGAARVLMHQWHARLHAFDAELPDFTPQPVYPARNETLRSYGLRTMGYVNSYVVNFGSQAFFEHNVSSIGLPRRYRSFFDLSGLVEPLHDFGNACAPSPECPNGELLYMDPLAASWREDHIAKMIAWNQATTFDANYEDTAGLVGDFGNGARDGLSAAQGSARLFQELQARHPVPLATEYGADAIAFAVRWPLRFQQAWGDFAFRDWLTRHQRPVSSFLFGPGQAAWVPTVRARDNFHRHVVVATSDALGGVAQFQATRWAYRATRGDLGHAKYRAQLFATLGLHPAFETERGAPTQVALYRSSEGDLFEYHVDASEQRLLGPDGQALYARIGGVAEWTSDLVIEGWPAWDGLRSFGLNPLAHYNLSPLGSGTEAVVTELPPGVKVSRYSETPTHVVLVVDSLAGPDPSSATIGLEATVPFLRLILNDVATTPPPGDGTPVTYTSSLPARFVLTKQPGAVVTVGNWIGGPADIGRFIEKETGIDRGGEGPAWHAQAGMKPDPDVNVWLPAFMPENGQNAPQTFEYLLRVPTPNAIIEVYVCAGSWDSSEAVLSLNAAEVHRTGQTPPTGFCNEYPAERVLLPVGRFYPGEILLGMALDNGADDDETSDVRFFTRPRFIVPN